METALPYVKAGKLRPLAVTSYQRNTLYPDVQCKKTASLAVFLHLVGTFFLMFLGFLRTKFPRAFTQFRI